MKRGVSIREHVNNFTKLLSDIANVDIMIEDEDNAMLLFCSLPEDDFGTFVFNMINERTTVSYKEVTSVLINYELRKGDGEPSEKASGDALAVREGHWKNECPNLKDRAWKQRGKAVQALEVNVAKAVSDHSDSDYSDYSCPALPSVCYADSTEWMMDSGATFRICPKSDWFSSFEELERGDVVLMENDHVCSIGGISTVRIMMHDGVTRELKEVRFVPQLKNIISLGTLEAAGYRVILEDATVKVTKGSMLVIRDVRESNLYYLKGKTVTGALTASITTEKDTTTL
ncbi:uncharacterized protein A4U43_C09F5950 [Asparagus officinalis]|uniref:Retrovirus-related Pol polyprotein from transposon TNT 1-94-like beta-barrel domain-containing protein n=1 Tax=Asparagus officinalis TaxID=4686 RepID=A0A5P1E5V7_ASPOF|nr:uncharacterized protein A4U43_C09F5950 [Asparagus officinalis]